MHSDIAAPVRICAICQQPGEFYATFGGSRCKACVLKRNKVWRDKNRERFNANRRDWWKRSGNELVIRRRMQMRAHRLGIPVEQLEEMDRQQDNKCFLCGQEGGRTKGTSLQLDHCHRTGQVRRLLCGRCNGLLARAEDSPGLLERVIAYLKGEI